MNRANSAASDGAAVPDRREPIAGLGLPGTRARFEAMHVNHLGLGTRSDWDLLKIVGEQDWVLVTNNAIEFRGRYRQIELHPGIVFLLPSVRRPDQLRLFEAALSHLQRFSDIVNRAIDVSFSTGGTVCLTTYELP